MAAIFGYRDSVQLVANALDSEFFEEEGHEAKKEKAAQQCRQIQFPKRYKQNTDAR